MKGKKQKGQKEEILNENIDNINDCEAGCEQSQCCCQADNEAEQNNCEQGELEQLKKSLEEKSKESEENYNRFLRMQADFENYKRRIAREREELYYSSLEGIVKELLPVIDNMERALAAFKADNLDNKYIDGVDMISKQLLNTLQKNGLKEIEAQDKDFDPNVHHAVMQTEGEDDEENKIKEVFQKGYTLGSKVIRPSLVKVSVKNS